MLHKIKNKFSIERIGYPFDQMRSPSFDFKGESHDFIEAVYVVSGSVQVTEDEKVYVLSEGDIIFHAPMEFHCIKSYNDTAPHIRNLSFTVNGDAPVEIFDGVYHLTRSQAGLFTECFEHTLAYCNSEKKTRYSGQYLQSLLSVLLIDVLRDSEMRNAISTEGTSLIYAATVSSMRASLYSNLSLEELAKGNGISVSYMKKLFMRYASASPKVFYNSLRAKEAAFLLESGKTVAEISESMSFSSPNYFCLFFKKHLGCTPSEYKKRGGYRFN